MSVTVSIPTILRTHTGGEKRVEGSGSTLAALIDDLETGNAGLKERLVAPDENGTAKLHRFVNIYVDDEDIRFTGGLGTAVKDASTVVILPAVAGG